MKFKKDSLLELRQILKEDFNFEPNDKELSNFAYSLVGYFDLLLKVDSRHKFRNSSLRAIDTKEDTVFDKEEAK